MKKETFTVLVTEDCRIDGEHVAAGAVLELPAEDAHSVVAAGRGTVDEKRVADARASAKGKKAAE